MKRLAVILATTCLAASLLGVGAASATANAELTIAAAGTKKAEATWLDWTLIEPTAVFDAYWVVADDDVITSPFTADRGRFVDDAAPRSVTFDDLNAGTTYNFKVYAVDYTSGGITIVPPVGAPAEAAIGATTATYSPLTIKVSKQSVMSGSAVTISGTLVDNTGKAIPDATVTVTSDPYPAGAPVTTDTTKTNADGRWSLSSGALTINNQFWANYLPLDGIGGWTGRVSVQVRKKISVAVSPGTTVAAGDTVRFAGQVSADPAYLDDSGSMAKICLQRLTAKWGSLKCVAINLDGSYLLKFQPGASADGKYRVFSGMGPAYGDSWSRTKTLTVN